MSNIEEQLATAKREVLFYKREATQMKIVVVTLIIVLITVTLVAAIKSDRPNSYQGGIHIMKVKVLRVSKPETFSNSMIIKPEYFDLAVHEFAAYVDTLVVGDDLRFEVIEISQEELDALPEFEGW